VHLQSQCSLNGVACSVQVPQSHFSCVLAAVGYQAVKLEFKLKCSLHERASLSAYSYLKFAQHSTNTIAWSSDESLDGVKR